MKPSPTHPAASDFVGTCAVCLRRHHNLGYAPTERHAIMWVCKPCLRSSEDAETIKRAYKMPKAKLDKYEEIAIGAGGEKAGAYLDELNCTDLAKLSPQEWEEFLARVLIGYSDKMREMMAGDTPPF